MTDPVPARLESARLPAEAALVGGQTMPADAGGRLRVAVWPALVGFLPVALLAAAQGGYFPSTWGWATLGLVWTAGIGLVLRARLRISRAEGAFVVCWFALAGWIALSTLWSQNVPQTVLEVERTLVYVTGVGAVIVLGRPRSARRILAAVLAAITLIAVFSLATRLFPGQFRVYDRTAVYRLSQPIGYWNGLAAFTAMGMILALGFVARARLLLSRAAAAAASVVIVTTFYFTFGRAGWIALGVGIGAMVFVDPRRLQLLTAGMATAPWAVAAVWLASHSSGLTQSGVSRAQAAHDGHRLAAWLLVLGAASAATAALVGLLEGRVSVSARGRRAFAAILVLASIALLVGVFARYGSPATLSRKGYDAFKAPPPHVVNLNRRLTSFSGNGRYELWRLAWTDARQHPWLGSGAGTYERYFLRHQPASVGRVRDAHGLYIEVLAELGPFGLGLLVAALGIPLLVAVRTRRHPLVSAAAGAYVVFLVHALVDWDWELPAVTLAALVCGGAILVVDRRMRRTASLSPSVRGVTLAVAVLVGAFASIGLVGNNALKTSSSARRAADWGTAASEARKARTWQPWSPRPWSALGEAQLGAGLLSQARASFRKAASMDPGDWQLWYDVARASTGQARLQALRRATALYPRSRLAPLAAAAQPKGDRKP